MSALVLLLSADLDVQEAFEYYEDYQAGCGAVFLRRLGVKCSLISPSVILSEASPRAQSKDLGRGTILLSYSRLDEKGPWTLVEPRAKRKFSAGMVRVEAPGTPAEVLRLRSRTRFAQDDRVEERALYFTPTVPIF